MDKITDLPFNVTLFDPSDDRLSRIRPTRVVDIYDGQTNNFHEDGLYSLLTYGDVQGGQRDSRFSYIELNTEVFHPFLFRQILRIKGFYKEILSGKKYATWNAKEGDFVASNALDGETGFGFFYKHYPSIKFQPTGSSERQLRIDLLKKFMGRHYLKRHLVIPAGLRDIEINDAGRAVETEINELYRKIIAISRTLSAGANDINDPLNDRGRYNLQVACDEIFELIYKMVTGKRGFIQKKFASRNVVDGTRNVITGLDSSSASLNDPRQVTANHTMFGLFQTMRGVLPVTVNRVKNGFLSEVLSEGAREANLVNPDTLEAEQVVLSTASQDKWNTIEGIKKLIYNFSYDGLRHKNILIEGRYIGLVYQDDTVFKFFHDIRELPENFSKDNVRPITWGEFFYQAIYRSIDKFTACVTRYPVTGAGSTYACYPYVKTTVAGLKLKELNNLWEEDEGDTGCLEYPDAVNKLPWVDSMCPATSRIKLLGGD